LLLLYSRGGLLLLLRNGLSFGHLGELEPEDSDGGSLDRLSCGVAIESYRRSRHVVMWFCELYMLTREYTKDDNEILQHSLWDSFRRFWDYPMNVEYYR
jgi:hypothetical protein